MAITVKWDDYSKKEWEQYLQPASSYAYQQDYAYGEAVRMLGGHVLRAVIYDDAKAIGLVQCHPRRWCKLLNLALIMRGPVWLADMSDTIKCDCYDAIRQSIPISWPRACLIMPEVEDTSALNNQSAMVSGYSTVIIDLSLDEEMLMQQLDGKWRNRLRAAQKETDLDVVPVGLKLPQYRWLLEKEIDQRSSIGYKAISLDLVPAYQSFCGKNSLAISRADYRGKTVAGIICLLHGNTATYHIGWSDEMGKDAGAHNLLMWHMMLQLKKRGIRWFDLGGVNTEDGAGIARFKIGTGGEVITLPGTYI